MAEQYEHLKALHERRASAATAYREIAKHHANVNEAVKLQREAKLLKFNRNEVQAKYHDGNE